MNIMEKKAATVLVAVLFIVGAMLFAIKISNTGSRTPLTDCSSRDYSECDVWVTSDYSCTWFDNKCMTFGEAAALGNRPISDLPKKIIPPTKPYFNSTMRKLSKVPGANTFCITLPPLYVNKCTGAVIFSVPVEEMVCTDMGKTINISQGKILPPNNITIFYNRTYAFTEFVLDLNYYNGTTIEHNMKPYFQVNNDNVICPQVKE